MATARSTKRRLAPPRLSRRALRRNLIAVSIGLAAALLFGYAQFAQAQALYQGGPLYAIETALHDLILRGRDPAGYGSTIGRDPRSFITIVAMDDKSLAELGVFRSWPRTYHAQVLDNLLVSKPRAVAFDVGFFEPAAEDQALIDALLRARSTAPAVAVVLASGGGIQMPATGGELQFRDALLPIPAIASAADVASANVVPDDFGSVRAMPLVMGMNGQERPSLGLAAFAKYLRLRTFEVDRPTSETLRVIRRAGDTVQAVREEVPVDRNSMVRINYFGPPSVPGATTFNIVSFVDVMKGRADPAIWRDGCSTPPASPTTIGRR
jgi:CHASE2 domain-containing sensor protein